MRRTSWGILVTLVTLVATGLALLAGCPDHPKHPACTAGEQRTCDCALGGTGVQYCNAQGAWDACLGCPSDTCGNGTCDASETPESCPEDCQNCGNGTCDASETPESCPEDCQNCGDGIVAPPEECDGANLNGHDCVSLGFTGGTLRCGETCAFDTSACVNLPGCGDGVLDASEICDGQSFGTATCADFGYSAGRLACRADCSGVIVSGCFSSGVCGDLVWDPYNEQCEGSFPPDEGTCADFGYTGGSLACAANCTLDVSNCNDCGNGILDGPEPCDGANLNGATCASQGFGGGTLACASDCHSFDFSGCVNGCGNGIIEGSELMQYQDAGDQQGASATIGIKGTSGFGVELACNTAGSLSDGLAVCFHKPGSGGCTP